MIKFILKVGADINGKGNQSLTPVMWAVFNNRIHAVELFVKNNCDLSILSNRGISAIDYAILDGNYVMAYYLYK